MPHTDFPALIIQLHALQADLEALPKTTENAIALNATLQQIRDILQAILAGCEFSPNSPVYFPR